MEKQLLYKGKYLPPFCFTVSAGQFKNEQILMFQIISL